MIKVYYTTYKERLKLEQFEKYLELMPSDIRKKVLKYKSWQDQHASLMGKLLLQRGLEDFKSKFNLESISYTKYCRPYINNSNLDFNISHSGFAAACAFSTEGTIGLDLEEVKDLEIEIFKSQFSMEEWDVIKKSENKCERFYTYWTIKEAVIKGDGKGLSIPLNEVVIKEQSVELEKEIWFVKKVDLINGYISHVVSNEKINQNISVMKIMF